MSSGSAEKGGFMNATHKPRLLDLFSGAGGAAKGYYDAGFEVTGIDIVPQPHYPYRFIQADALTFPLDGFDVIHTSPPCQHYTFMLSNNPCVKEAHPDLLAIVRKRIQKAAPYWVIENVPGAPVEHGVLLCGSMFGLRIRRHRYFETSHLLMLDRQCKHNYRAIQVVGHAGKKQNYTTEAAQEAMGIDWMTKRELVQAIPPVYTHWIGQQLMQFLQAESQVPA